MHNKNNDGPTAMTTETMTSEMTAIGSDPSILLSKRAVYVGGLSDEITPTLLRAAFIPFGDIKSVDIPMDYEKGTHRGFAFLEFGDAEDASEAVFNMDGADMQGRSIRVSVAQANQASKLMSGVKTKSSGAIWNSDEWFQANAGGEGDNGDGGDGETKEEKESDENILKDDRP